MCFLVTTVVTLKYNSTTNVEIEFIATGTKVIASTSNIKKAKERCIQEYAEMHKYELQEFVYKALMDYKIDITD